VTRKPATSQTPGPEAFLPLRPVEYHVLLSLSHRERHGYGIMLDAEERTGTAFQIGTFYRALARMKQAGLIEDAEERPDTGDDERRNYYRITALGRAVATAESERMAALLREARAGGLLGQRGGR
jgi:DNA-binding PadR family transcriptional regulator